jgi:DNA-binding GntR family transcriptional regulator
LAQVHVSWLRVLERTGYIPREFAERQDQHWAVVTAVEKRDVMAARKAMEIHLDKVPGITS